MRKMAVLALVLLTTSCASTSSGEIPEPSGPPDIQFDLVRQHAEQFDVDLPDRPPGSQHELAAASYILGHLQLAGYGARLDRVPVADTLNSTNVVAYPPSGADPLFLVALPYDTPAPTSDSGSTYREQIGKQMGLFLELARALSVANPDHRVAFAALGAETDDSRGTRRLAQFMLDEDIDASVLLFTEDEANPATALIVGSCQGETSVAHFATTFTDGDCVDSAMSTGRGSALIAAGFQLTLMQGDERALGRELLSFLLRAGS
jgi:hypothetical protein